MAKATSIFKYRTFNKSTIELFVNKELWFAKPDSLNDPFECQPSFSRVLDSVWNNYNVVEDDKNTLENALKKQLSVTGICAFCRTRKNQLMLSHYADEHRGLCIGFNQKVLSETSDKFYPINVDYQAALPYKKIIERMELFKESIYQDDLNGITGDILYSIIGTKYTSWGYEKEVRLVRHQFGTMKFQPTAVNSIAFGLRASDRDKQTLKILLKGSEWDHVKWFRSEKMDDKFGINFIEEKYYEKG